MSKRILTLTGVVIGVPLLLALAWWLISPLFITRTVDEAFPTSTGGAVNDEVVIPTEPMESATNVETPTPAMAEDESAMTEEEASATMDDASTSADDNMEMEATATPEPTATEMPIEATPTEAPEVAMVEEVIPVFPQTLTQGTFYPLVHAVQGTATIYLLEDGTRTLRFENFVVDNGPDLAVWLVPNESVPNQIGVVPEGYYELAKLKGNEGNQNYEIPADLDLSLYKSVVVWCVTFSVPFAAAPLQSVAPEAEAATEAMDESEEAMTETAPAYEPIPLTVELQDLGAAPEITNDVWINADAPVRLADLRGKVVVIEFWTYGCYNCQNVLPYIKAWDAKYAGNDFEVVSVHYPEFTYEREIENVRAAVQEAGIEYPVAIDNDGVTWRAYQQRYWPVWYVVDKNGVIRYKHIGEGGYTETEGVIQALLAE